MTVADPGPGSDAHLAGELLDLARDIAEEVGRRLVVSLAGERPAMSAKSTPTDLVTELDHWAEGHITERILAARPHDGIIGEEGVDITGTSGVTWSIDPIDGTVNFVHGIPGFSVSIAARLDGEGIAGTVVSPLHGDTFTATRGGGAFRNGERIAASRPPSVARSVIGTGFSYEPERRRRQAEVLVRVLPRIADVRRFGSAAVDLCWVACGRLDGYWEVGLNDWDLAAGVLIATEAGARCGDLDGGAPSPRFVLAAPADTFDELAALLRDADAANG